MYRIRRVTNLLCEKKITNCKVSDEKNFFGEFDPGSERTLAAWIRHASRTGAAMHQWRKGEERVSNLPSSLE